MRKIPKGYETELLILRIFLKHVKLNHMYHIFRCSVGIQHRHKDLFHTIASRVLRNYNSISKLGSIGSYYMNANSLKDLMDMMRGMYGGDVKNIDDSGKGQLALMNVVNGLIHSCIEYAVKDNFGILEKIGEGAFTEICEKLFGDKFEDKTKEAIDPRYIEMIEKYGRMMPPPQMMDRRRRGEMPPPPNQEEFQRWIEDYVARMPHPEIMEEQAEQPQIFQPNGFYIPDDDWEDDWEDI